MARHSKIWTAGAVLAAVLAAGCSNSGADDDDDVALPDAGTGGPDAIIFPDAAPIVCGDGVVIGGAEGCDDGDTDPDDGCDELCQVEDGFSCTGEPSVCVEVEDPDPGCDLRGTWAMREVTFQDTAAGVMTNSTWYYWQINHAGTAIEVAEGIGCGARITGGEGVTFADTTQTPETVRSMLSRTGGTGTTGTYADNGSGGCDLTFDDRVTIRGATISHYGVLKTDYESLDPTVDQLFVSELPVKDSAEAVYDGMTLVTPGWEDWEPDGNPGVRWVVDVFLFGGSRHSVARDLLAYSGTTAQDASTFEIGIDFQVQEEILHLADNTFLEDSGALKRDANDFVVFKRVPADFRVIGADGDFQTCLKIQSEPGLEHVEETP